jgi:hypothetical protein
MTAIKRKLPRDPNQRAKSIVDIVAAISEGADPETLSDPSAKFVFSSLLLAFPLTYR